MSKSKFQTVYGVKIYPIDYLCNNELTESDLNNLLDDNKKGLIYSLIIGWWETTWLSEGNPATTETIFPSIMGKPSPAWKNIRN